MVLVRAVAGAAGLALALVACGPAQLPDEPGPRTSASSASSPPAASQPSAAAAPAPRNVVIMVGDGLGAGAREATRLVTVGARGRLAMDRLEFAGWVRTDSADRERAVTDSAAAATALATGVRTRNRAVGIDRHGEPVRSLLERAKHRGMATGIVTTSEVTDATPAAFAAHVRKRGRHTAIARQYVRETKPDVILGGGAALWPAKLLARAERAGWELVRSRRELRESRSPRVLGLFSDREMFDAGPEGSRAQYAPDVPLRALTAKALEILSADDDGFFLVVEEEAIDEMAHANNAELTIAATAAFDQAVATVLRFARDNPQTLVVVLGDHETGGMAVESVPEGSLPRGVDGPFRIEGSERELVVDWTGRAHTGSATPLSAEGPGAERLARAQHLTDVHDVVLEVLRGR